MRYVDVILPLPLSDTYTYALPDDCSDKVCPGHRVIVPFGAKKFYTAIVCKVHDVEPSGYTVKTVLEILDPAPVLLPLQMSFWNWMADYCLCTVGEVFKAALPSGMKLESESRVMLNEDYEGEERLSEKECRIFTLLGQKSMTVAQLQKACEGAHTERTVRAMVERGILIMCEEVKRTYKPRTETHVRLSASWFSEARVREALDSLRRAEKQQLALLKYLDISGAVAALRLQNPKLLAEVERKSLAKVVGCTVAVCRALEEKGILEAYSYETGRLADSGRAGATVVPPLSEAQSVALDQIHQAFTLHPVCLLHGVTSSGKTEVYIHLIEEVLAKGKQVLYLVPEIVLTTQLTDRLYRVFGSRMGVFHSKFPDAERVEIWRKQLSDKPYDIILGARSSVFLPFQRLGLVIVDEEQEPSFKQQDPAPRYHGRNAAVMLAHMSGAHTLLGSATPSMESYFNAQSGKYGLVELKERFGHVQLPEIEIVDIKELQHKKRMSGPFSPRLLEVMRDALNNHGQIILFQNRRGYAPMIECRVCGWTPRCVHCDVSLTYHRGLRQMTCHYCGYTTAVPTRCPACGEESIVQIGYGTERVEDAVHQYFPEARVARMDLDTTRTMSAYEGILSSFQQGETDILVGTQMVTKGLDFGRVSVVGILNADHMLNIPDFRSYERAFQMMAQVAGRAGRRSRQGRVVLQTKMPDLQLVSQVQAHDYQGLFQAQMEERHAFNYPPFCRLLYVYLKHSRSDVLDKLAKDFATAMRTTFGNRVLGPDAPPVSRVQSLFIRKVMLKIEPGASLPKVRDCLLRIRDGLMAQPAYRGARVYFDMDPV